jgi:hypothetical protein
MRKIGKNNYCKGKKPEKALPNVKPIHKITHKQFLLLQECLKIDKINKISLSVLSSPPKKICKL